MESKITHWLILLFYLSNDGWVKFGEVDSIEEANNWCNELKGERCWRAMKHE